MYFIKAIKSNGSYDILSYSSDWVITGLTTEDITLTNPDIESIFDEYAIRDINNIPSSALQSLKSTYVKIVIYGGKGIIAEVILQFIANSTVTLGKIVTESGGKVQNTLVTKSLDSESNNPLVIDSNTVNPTIYTIDANNELILNSRYSPSNTVLRLIRKNTNGVKSVISTLVLNTQYSLNIKIIKIDQTRIMLVYITQNSVRMRILDISDLDNLIFGNEFVLTTGLNIGNLTGCNMTDGKIVLMYLNNYSGSNWRNELVCLSISSDNIITPGTILNPSSGGINHIVKINSTQFIAVHGGQNTVIGTVNLTNNTITLGNSVVYSTYYVKGNMVGLTVMSPTWFMLSYVAGSSGDYDPYYAFMKSGTISGGTTISYPQQPITLSGSIGAFGACTHVKLSNERLMVAARSNNSTLTISVYNTVNGTILNSSNIPTEYSASAWNAFTLGELIDNKITFGRVNSSIVELNTFLHEVEYDVNLDICNTFVGTPISSVSNVTWTNIVDLNETYYAVIFNEATKGGISVFERTENGPVFKKYMVFNTGSVIHTSAVKKKDLEVLITYRDGGQSNYGVCVLVSYDPVSNNLSLQNENVFNMSATFRTSVVKIDTDTFVISYYKSTATNKINLRVVKFDENNVYSQGNEFTSTDTVDNYINIIVKDSTHFNCIYKSMETNLITISTYYINPDMSITDANINTAINNSVSNGGLKEAIRINSSQLICVYKNTSVGKLSVNLMTDTGNGFVRTSEYLTTENPNDNGYHEILQYISPKMFLVGFSSTYAAVFKVFQIHADNSITEVLSKSMFVYNGISRYNYNASYNERNGIKEITFVDAPVNVCAYTTVMQLSFSLNGALLGFAKESGVKDDEIDVSCGKYVKGLSNIVSNKLYYVSDSGNLVDIPETIDTPIGKGVNNETLEWYFPQS